MNGPSPGLCGSCRFAKTIASARGSTFWLCERAAADPRFRKYPLLPVVTCPGFEPQPSAPPEALDGGP